MSPAKRSFLFCAADIAFIAFLVTVIGWSLSRDGRRRDIDNVRALTRVASRTFDIAEAFDQASTLDRWIFRMNGIDTIRNRAEVIEWFSELDASQPERSTRCRLALLRSSGNEGGGPVGATVSSGQSASNEEALRDCFRDPGELGALFPPGWFRDRALREGARRNIDVRPISEDQALGARRATREFRKMCGVHWLNFSFVLAGSGCCAWGYYRKRRGFGAQRLWTDTADAPWPGGAGGDVILSLLAGGFLVILLLTSVAAELISVRALCLFLALIGAALFGLNLRKRNISFDASIGLDASPGGLVRLLMETLKVSAVTIFGSTFIQWAFERLGYPAHWREWYNDDLVFGPPALVGVLLIGSCVFSPLVEELALRGMLYPIVRRATGSTVGLVVSAIVFGFMHGTGLPTVLTLTWCGFFWALSYEKTGSLLPAILSHSLNNLLYALSVIVFLRA